MSIWALSDLHLSFSVPEKSMEYFGSLWEGYASKIEKNWRAVVCEDDLVLVPGDICWATRPEEAAIDLAWIEALPGTKLFVKGNHDYWWGSKKKTTELLPPSIHILQNDTFLWNGVAFGGARLWGTAEYTFNDYIHFKDNPKAKVTTAEELKQERIQGEKIFAKELERLRLSLSALPKDARCRIALTHYPPIGPDRGPSKASKILEKFGIQACVFGHLHNVDKEKPLFGTARGITYHLTSCDYLDFEPIKIYSRSQGLLGVPPHPQKRPQC